MLGSSFYTYEVVAHMCGRTVYVLYVILMQAATLFPIVRCCFPHHRSLFIFTICSVLRHSFFSLTFHGIYKWMSILIGQNLHTIHTATILHYILTQCISSFHFFSYFQLNAGHHRLIFMWANAFWSSLSVHTRTRVLARICTFSKIGNIW